VRPSPATTSDENKPEPAGRLTRRPARPASDAPVSFETTPSRDRFLPALARDLVRNRYVYLMVVPVILYYLLFHYGPMYGAIIAFKNFSPVKGILGSPWAGLTHFKAFISSYYFVRILRNTLVINLGILVFGFPMPILLALLLNEIRDGTPKRFVQTVSYLPHFISIMVVCGIIINFTSRQGLINDVIAALGGTRASLLLKPEAFRPIYVISDVWQTTGWGSIIYLAALSAVDPQLYEAADMDGAGRLRKIWNISVPGILPTVTILLVLRMGTMMSIGFEKVLLLVNQSTLETGDVISSFVYRRGILELNFSYSAAVGLFNSVINFALLLASNWMARRLNQASLF
jgi:putative aldouronate transport system permease protein